MINYNGDILPNDALFLNSRNSAFQFGDTIFELLRYTGDRILFLESHYFRLMAVMRQLRMEIPMHFTLEFLESQMLYTLKANGIISKPSQIKISIFRNIYTASGTPMDHICFVIEHSPLEAAAYKVESSERTADIFKDYLIPLDGFSSLPMTNGPIRKLAEIYARENGFDTVLLLNQQKEVCETLDGTLFLRFDNELVTPPNNSGCGLSIIRDELINFILKNKEFNIDSRPISPFDLQKADEIFSVSEEKGFSPVSKLKKANYTKTAAERLSRLFNASLFSEPN